ncbi:MAG: hypothetical protein LBC12_00605 [Nitrososphaerota archaeon]|jgi:hypothetical protein|nr:hypothetical protein [Nitrososphaerota archaeon]
MENNMTNSSSSLKFKIGLLLPIFILVCLFAAFWAASIIYSPIQRPSHYFTPADFEFFYFAHAIISTINVALLLVLSIIFISVYRKTRSEFSFGLIAFGFAFLLKDIASSPFVAGIFSFYATGLGPFIVLPDIFELAALSVLLYLNLKY